MERDSRNAKALHVCLACFAALVLLCSGFMFSYTPYSADAVNNEVRVSIVRNAADLGDRAYSPGIVEIKVGDVVTWINDDLMVHTATSKLTNGGSVATFDTGTMGPKRTFSFKFTKAGEFSYSCLFHPSMTGVVKVTEDGSAGTDASDMPVVIIRMDKTTYSADEAITVHGIISSNTETRDGNTTAIITVTPPNRDERQVTTLVPRIGTFDFILNGPFEISSIGTYRVTVLVDGASTSIGFKVNDLGNNKVNSASSEQAKVRLQVAAVGKQTTNNVVVTTISARNLGIGNVPVNEISIILPTSLDVKSLKAPVGWNTEQDGALITFLTDSKPIESGKRFVFRIYSDTTIETLEWLAFDLGGNLLDDGSTKVKNRRMS